MRLRLGKHSLAASAIILLISFNTAYAQIHLPGFLSRPILITKRISMIRQSAVIIRLLNRALKTGMYIITWEIVILRRENWARPSLITSGPGFLCLRMAT